MEQVWTKDEEEENQGQRGDGEWSAKWRLCKKSGSGRKVWLSFIFFEKMILLKGSGMIFGDWWGWDLSQVQAEKTLEKCTSCVLVIVPMINVSMLGSHASFFWWMVVTHHKILTDDFSDETVRILEFQL